MSKEKNRIIAWFELRRDGVHRMGRSRLCRDSECQNIASLHPDTTEIKNRANINSPLRFSSAFLFVIRSHGTAGRRRSRLDAQFGKQVTGQKEPDADYDEYFEDVHYFHLLNPLKVAVIASYDTRETAAALGGVGSGPTSVGANDPTPHNDVFFVGFLRNPAYRPPCHSKLDLESTGWSLREFLLPLE